MIVGMTLLATRKSTLRVRGIARRKKLLDSARQLLQSKDMDEISLGDVARHAGVAKGSAYHFYANIKDVYASLVIELDEQLHKVMIERIRKPVRSWSEVIDILLVRAAHFYAENPSARQLLIGPKTLPELKLRDRQSDVVIGRMFEDHVNTFFELPSIPGRSAIFFRAIEIADLMFCLSMLNHGDITEEMSREATRAAVAYLGSYVPATLPRRRRR